jgi:GntR family transcriptional regulator / MocR family aminotransferase
VRDFLFPLHHDRTASLQAQLRRHLMDAILDGRLTPDDPLPSSRRLAQALGISRNTVVLAYQALADEGFLVSRERVGFFVNPEALGEPAPPDPPAPPTHPAAANWNAVDWQRRLRIRPTQLNHIRKPKNWRRYPYPFIYGQVDPKLFPVAAWRMCSRQALSLSAIESWTEDSFVEDAPLLIEQIRTRVLPRRGVRAAPDEILITLGAQNALFMIAQLLAGPNTRFGFEDPGYVDARNIFAMTGATIVPLPVDEGGMQVDARLKTCDCVYVTPSHQAPTTVTMPLARRVKLLELASRHGVSVIEDDYEPEANFISAPTPALKSMDKEHAVVYVGSFSKSLAPGLRIGFLVASAELIREARLFRRLALRHPPSNNQRTLALFIAGGYYEALIHRLQRAYRERWEALGRALARHLPDWAATPTFGGTSYWIRGPENLDSDRLARDALSAGIIIEAGTIHFASDPPPRNYFRLGFSSIPCERIEPGIEKLAALLRGETGAARSAAS